jgi:hypothetical protein
MKMSLLIASALIFAPLTIHSYPTSNILSHEDLWLEMHDRQQDRYSIGIPNEEGGFEKSFNHWLCFEMSAVEVVRAETTYDGENKFLPLLSIEGWNRNYEISVDGDFPDDQDRTLTIWQFLVDDAQEVCVYAAYLQTDGDELETPRETWIISKLKTHRGYWDNWHHDDD